MRYVQGRGGVEVSRLCAGMWFDLEEQGSHTLGRLLEQFRKLLHAALRVVELLEARTLDKVQGREARGVVGFGAFGSQEVRCGSPPFSTCWMETMIARRFPLYFHAML